MTIFKKLLRTIFSFVPQKIKRIFFRYLNEIIFYFARGTNIKWCQIASENYIDESSYCWGKSIDQEVELGDYRFIRDSIVKPFAMNKITLEIGCLDGKWSVPICSVAQHTYLCDLDEIVVKALSDRLRKNNISDSLWTWKKINGKNLDCVPSNSVDFIFSFDSLVRCPKEYIFSYLEDIVRVLKPKESIAMIHLPIYECKNSRSKRFTKLRTLEVVDILNKLDVNYSFKNIVKLGRILFIFPEKKYKVMKNILME